jgi:hypothetical protein
MIKCHLFVMLPFKDFGGFRSNTSTTLMRTYGNVGGIDLCVGGLIELPVTGSYLGPSFGCFIALQVSDGL